MVLCADKKGQVRTLDRTTPCLPILPSTPAQMIHDYVRNATTNLFAALEAADASVIAQHYRRCRHQEFLRFLTLLDAAVPSGLELQLILASGFRRLSTDLDRLHIKSAFRLQCQ